MTQMMEQKKRFVRACEAITLEKSIEVNKCSNTINAKCWNPFSILRDRFAYNTLKQSKNNTECGMGINKVWQYCQVHTTKFGSSFDTIDVNEQKFNGPALLPAIIIIS